MKTYTVHEAFLTIQGEGFHVGTRAVFVRLAGCNVWSGREEDRERDSAKGTCALWCDTEFKGTGGVNGGRYTADQLALLVCQLWGEGRAFAVFTGGEPSLQIDDELVRVLRSRDIYVAVETNGSKKLPSTVNWITLSPKPPMPVVDQEYGYDEVKVVLPAVDPAPFFGHAANRFVQPLDGPDKAQSLSLAVEYVMLNPGWRLSLQTHKIVGVR